MFKFPEPALFATGLDIGHLELIVGICDLNRLEIRQIEKAIDLLATIDLVWNEDCQIELALIFPMIVAFIKGNDLFDDEKIRASFSVNGDNIGIAGYNFDRIFGVINAFKDTRIISLRSHLESRYGNINRRVEIDREIIVVVGILEAEIKSRGRVNSFPLFTTYAKRIRMAGRFVQ